jgi:hypothetical protein
MVTLCLCVTMSSERLHGHPTAKGDHATPATFPQNVNAPSAAFSVEMPAALP